MYQVQAHRIQILHESDEAIKELTVPTLPCKLQNALAFNASPRKAPSSAFSAFGSPSKKARHMWISHNLSICHVIRLPVHLITVVEPHLYNPMHSVFEAMYSSCHVEGSGPCRPRSALLRYTVHRTEIFMEIGPFLPENEEVQCRLEPTAIPFFVLGQNWIDFHKFFGPMHCIITFYTDIQL